MRLPWGLTAVLERNGKLSALHLEARMEVLCLAHFGFYGIPFVYFRDTVPEEAERQAKGSINWRSPSGAAELSATHFLGVSPFNWRSP